MVFPYYFLIYHDYDCDHERVHHHINHDHVIYFQHLRGVCCVNESGDGGIHYRYHYDHCGCGHANNV